MKKKSYKLFPIPNLLSVIKYLGKLRLFNSRILVYQQIILPILLSLIFWINTSNLPHSIVPQISAKSLVKNSPVTYKTSWLGNTIGGGKLRVQNNIEAMYVTANGTIYTNSHWDEAGTESVIYQDGKVIAALEDTHGWNRGGGKAITGDQNYIYLAMVQEGMNNPQQDYPAVGTTWFCVRRYDKSGKPAPFLGGRGWDKTMLITSNKNEVTGLAIAENKLYVSQASANQILIYNTRTMQKIGSFAVSSPEAIAIDRSGNLWVIHSKTADISPRIWRYSPQGIQLAEIKDIVEPTAIAIDHQGRLLVTENGPRQQILIYDINKQPVQIGTFGDKKGIYGAVPGEVKDLKFYGLTGIGTDAGGNIYLNNSSQKSGTDLRKFSPSGKKQWQLLGLIFVDNADSDPKTDGIEVFTKVREFSLDYSQVAGKQWTYKSYTLNPFKYPQDPRLHTSPDGTFFRRIQGRPILFLTDMYNSFLQIYRFQPSTDGKIAIPSGMFVGSKAGAEKSIIGDWPANQPLKGEWIWRDMNGNGAFEQNEYDTSQDYPYIGGWWVDNRGDIWKALRTQDGIGIRHYPFQGFDHQGNPIYKYQGTRGMEKQKTPNIFNDLRRIEYFPETDTMYLSGFTLEHPAIKDDAKIIGTEIARFDHWSQGNRLPRWRTLVPYDSSGNREVTTAALSVGGEYVFAVTVKPAEIYVYKAATGKLVRKLKPGQEVGGVSGWIDIPYGIRAFRRADGEYLVFVEEDLQGKVIIYQFK
jgi:outer membrane protein assembly factor BamB